MLTIKLSDPEVGDSELVLDLEKSPNNFILGFIQGNLTCEPEERLNIGFIPNSTINTILDLAYSQCDELSSDAYDALDDRDASETKVEWNKHKDRAEEILEEYRKVALVHGAFGWNDGDSSSFIFWDEEDKFLDADTDYQRILKRLNEPYIDKEIRDMKPDADGGYCF